MPSCLHTHHFDGMRFECLTEQAAPSASPKSTTMTDTNTVLNCRLLLMCHSTDHQRWSTYPRTHRPLV